MLCAVDYIFNLLCAFNCLQPMKKFVFSVASRATGRLQIKPSGSGDENGFTLTNKHGRSIEHPRRPRGRWWGLLIGARKLLCFSVQSEAERRRPFGTGLVRHCPQGLFSPFFTFLRAIFFRPFRLFLAPTISPWVSKEVDRSECDVLHGVF